MQGRLSRYNTIVGRKLGESNVRSPIMTMILKSINPATEELIATYEEFSPEQIDGALGEAERAFGEWRYTSFAERARLMRGAAATLRGEQARLAALVTAEMGKPIVE